MARDGQATDILTRAYMQKKKKKKKKKRDERMNVSERISVTLRSLSLNVSNGENEYNIMASSKASNKPTVSKKRSPPYEKARQATI